MDPDSILHGILDYFLYPVIILALINMQQKRHSDRCLRKRLATLIWVIVLVVFVIMVGFITAFDLPSYLGLFAFVLAVTALAVMRKLVWPFKRRCQICGEKLSFGEFLYNDGNICDSCLKAAQEKEGKEAEEAEEEPFIPEDSLRKIDFDAVNYRHKIAATFLFRDNGGKKEVLLIENKRGFAEGMVSAPAGHIEAAETAREAAVREVLEETGITVINPSLKAKAFYCFTDNANISTLFFTSDEFTGEAKETDEARPFWCGVDGIPYERMWEDNRYWLNSILNGGKRTVYATYTGYGLRSIKVEKEEE